MSAMLPMLNLAPSDAGIDPNDPTTREAVRQGFTLLLLLSIVGVLLVVSVTLLIVFRRQRHAQRDLDRRHNKPSGRASAWHAAGARAEPIHPDPDLPSDDDLRSPGDSPGDWDAQDLQ